MAVAVRPDDVVRPLGRPHPGSLTVVIPTLNEADRIGDCLSALDWVDEIIVIDGGSIDDTVRIAETLGATVLTEPGVSIGAQRNAGIACATSAWVLALDVDERVSSELCAELTTRLATAADVDCFTIRFREFYLGRELKKGANGRSFKPRLFRPQFRFTEVAAHERLEAVERTAPLDGTILHTSCRDFADQLRKVVLYSQWAADDMYARGRRTRFVDLAFRPFWRFFRDYVLWGSWRGGSLAFLLTALSAFSVFLKYAMLWMRHDAERRGEPPPRITGAQFHR
jgi:glycosyltransferase involved in cell wall biosynthesis